MNSKYKVSYYLITSVRLNLGQVRTNENNMKFTPSNRQILPKVVERRKNQTSCPEKKYDQRIVILNMT